MRRFVLLLIAFGLLAFPVSAQSTTSTQEEITLLDAVSARKFPKRWYEMTWLNDQAFVYTTDYSTLKLWDNGEMTDLLSGEDLLPEGMEAYPSVDGLRWESETKATYIRENVMLSYEVGGEATRLYSWTEEAENVDRSSGSAIAYTIDGNVYVMDEGMTDAVQVTDDASEDIVYGEAAHRSEFGIVKGLFWSGDGQKLAFYRIDQSNIPDYPLINQQVIPAEVNNIRYPMAGRASQQVTVGVFNRATGTTTYLKTEEQSEQYLTNITWSLQGDKVYVAVVNRDQDHLWLNRYDAASGAFEATLFEETDQEYVEPEHGLFFLPDSEGDFLWFSERDGWQHLYHYKTDGTLVRQLTKGPYDVTEFVAFLSESNSALISSREDSPLNSHLYRVDLESGKSTRISDAPGVHSGTPSPSGNLVLDAWSSTDIPWNINLVATKKGKVKEELYQADNPLAGIEVGEMELVTLAASDGTPLYGRLIKPAGFDPQKQYPAIVYVYGGPHVQLIENSWLGGASMFFYYLAQHGYVVWTLDNRGTPNRGIDFEQATFRHLGTVEIEDQMTGVQYLKSLPFVDADRVGVHGWSFGGFMTTGLMTRKPGEFKVGVAGGPVIDWRMYEVMYTERYMDTPEQNPEGYEETSLLNYADSLEGKLLIIQGLQDGTVVPQHSNQFVRKCVQKGIQIDYFPYPTHEHNVRGRDRMHLLAKIKEYFDDYL